MPRPSAAFMLLLHTELLLHTKAAEAVFFVEMIFASSGQTERAMVRAKKALPNPAKEGPGMRAMNCWYNLTKKMAMQMCQDIIKRTPSWGYGWQITGKGGQHCL